MAMLPDNITITLEPVVAASIADLADSAQGLRVVFDKLEAREAAREFEETKETKERYEEAWPNLARELAAFGVDAEVLSRIKRALDGRSFEQTWSLYLVAKWAHWGRD